jgi:hypothetical protein
MNTLVTVARFTGPIEAHLAKGRLETEGIPTFIAHEHHIWAIWMYSDALGGIKLMVPHDKAEEARTILASHINGEYEAALKEVFPDVVEDKCPTCGSTQFERTAAGTQLLLAILTLGFIGIIFPLTKDNRRCLNCGTKWKHRL